MERSRLFVAPYLAAPEPLISTPSYEYDEAASVNVLPDGSPVVEASRSALGTGTFTKSTGEGTDSDEASMSTLTNTFTQAESTDRDGPTLWGGTQLDTRRLPADVEQD